MKPSEKVEKIKSISSIMANAPWPEIDFVFRQFKIPSSETWNGDKYSYLIEHLEMAENNSINELFDYHFKTEEKEGLNNHDNLWEIGYFKLFLSHISKDKIYVSEVKKELAQYAIDSFVAHEDIEPTKEWVHEIEKALNSCDALAAFMTPEFHHSFWTDQEIGFCIKRRILIVPIKLGIDPYGFISRYQAHQGKDKDPVKLAFEIFSILISHDLTSEKLSDSLVYQFENSYSFANAKRNVKLLDKIDRWTPQMLNRIEQASKTNIQIKQSYGVPAHVRSIIDSHNK